MAAVSASLNPASQPQAPATTGTSEPASQERLVVDHLPLVGHLVRETLGRLPAHVTRDELVSAGTLALVLAARAFDDQRGVSFSHFAAIRVRGAIADELRAQDWASRRVRTRSREAESVRSMLAARLSRSPSRAEVANAMGISIPELDALDTDLQRASLVRLDRHTVDETADLLPSPDETPEAALLRREQLGMMSDAIADLPDRLRTVIERYYFEQRPVTAIASELGVSEPRIYQLRTAALHALRAALQAHDPEEAGTAAHRAPGRAVNGSDRAAAVSTRASLAGRLAATSLLGEVRKIEPRRATTPTSGRGPDHTMPAGTP